MSSLLSLSGGYGSFFWGCTKFAVSPYTNTFSSIANAGGSGYNKAAENFIGAAVICGVLTFVVPVLPVLAAFTFALASIAMLLAVASMFLTYPCAAVIDACSPSNTQEMCF
jgi:hypothetical protein